MSSIQWKQWEGAVLQQLTALSALPTLTLNLHENINPSFTDEETKAQSA